MNSCNCELSTAITSTSSVQLWRHLSRSELTGVFHGRSHHQEGHGDADGYKHLDQLGHPGVRPVTFINNLHGLGGGDGCWWMLKMRTQKRKEARFCTLEHLHAGVSFERHTRKGNVFHVLLQRASCFSLISSHFDVVPISEITALVGNLQTLSSPFVKCFIS